MNAQSLGTQTLDPTDETALGWLMRAGCGFPTSDTADDTEQGR